MSYLGYDGDNILDPGYNYYLVDVILYNHATKQIKTKMH